MIAVLYIVAPLLGSYSLNFQIVCLSLVLFFVAQDILYQLAFIYYNEIASTTLRSKISIIGTYYAFGNLAINYILVFIPDYRDFYMLSLIGCTFAIWLVIKMIETPYFAFSTGKLIKYMNTLEDIGYQNGSNVQLIKQ